MAKRDVVAEILEVKTRKIGANSETLKFRFEEINKAYGSLSGSMQPGSTAIFEMQKYFPIAVVATLEGYFRSLFAELIDAGSPYIENAAKFGEKKDIKFDFTIVKSISGKQISLGEFIAHSLPLSSIRDIDFSMSTILGREFLKQLGEAKTTKISHPLSVSLIPILDNSNNIYRLVSRAFELRHIYCHEIASFESLANNEIEDLLTAAKAFVYGTAQYIADLNYVEYDVGMTQADMNEQSEGSKNDKLLALNEVFSKLKSLIPEDQHSRLNDWQIKWEQAAKDYSQEYAEFLGGGGTIWPVLYNTELERQIEKRISDLKLFVSVSDYGGEFDLNSLEI